MGRILFIIAFVLSHHLWGQGILDPTPTTPQVSSFQVITPGVNPTGSTSSRQINQSPFPNFNPSSNKQIAQYEKDRLRIEQEQEVLKNLYQDLDKKRSIQYSLPFYKNNPRTSHFYMAFDSLNNMDVDNFSIKRATFLVENAYYDNDKSYTEFETTVNGTIKFIQEVMREQQLDPNNNVDKNQALFAFMTDTLQVNGVTHYPFRYDFDDYMGQKNWDNMFVHKLIQEGSGQCNSLPRYYLILAEALETDSYLALAPRHSYIRFQDDDGEWFNAELTSGAIMTDHFMVESGYIKSEAVLSKSYLTEQTNRQVMSQLLNDLASGYISKFGYDGFVGKIIERSLELNPNGINGNLHRMQYLIAEFNFVVRQLGVQNREDVLRYPKLIEMQDRLKEQDKKLRNLGFEIMPQERYEAWLQDLERERERQELTLQKSSFRIDLNQLKN